MSKASLPLSTRLLAEALGTAILVATVVGSGIMAEDWRGETRRLRCSGIQSRRAQSWWCSSPFLVRFQEPISIPR